MNKCCKLFFSRNAMVSSIIPINVWLGYTNIANYFFPCNAMDSSNILINKNFVTIHKTGSSSTKIIKTFLGKESQKHPL